MNANDTKFKCDQCKYYCNYQAEWDRHIISKKHFRNGQPMTYICDVCNISFGNLWKLKHHKLSIHSTIEEREQMKYYCKVCDIAFFSKLFYDKHTNGPRCIQKKNNSLITQ